MAPRVGVRPGRVAAHDLDGRRGPRARLRREVGIELDQPRPDVAGAGVVGEHPEEVAAVSGAHADRPEGAGRRPVEAGADEPLHARAAAGQP